MNWSEKTKIEAITSQACPDRAVAFIRARYPLKAAEHVSADIGLPVHTVKRWLEGVAKPSWTGLSLLILAYGPAFLVAVYPKAPAWLDEAHRRERQDALRAEQRRIQEQLDALGA